MEKAPTVPLDKRLGGVFAGASEEVRKRITWGICAEVLEVPPRVPAGAG